jgi:aminomethyltransferase
MASDSDPMKTPFCDLHIAAGARMVSFAGWYMPVQYKAGIKTEHLRVRESVGLFDVSHMGEFLVEGPGALTFLQKMASNDVSVLEIGQAQYAVACLPEGGIVDDLLIYRRAEDRFLVCVNAGRLTEDWAWFSENHSDADHCTLTNASSDFAQLAIQGRNGVKVVQKLTDVDLSTIETYRFTEGIAGGVDCIIARTGYTGEDGFELFFHRDHADTMWHKLVDAGAEFDMLPIGLGARDTLRLEMKFCLYGNDIDETTSPLEARLGWITKWKAKEFIGQPAIAAQVESGVPRALVGFELTGRGVARHGYPVWLDGEQIGEVTSGALTPSVGKAIGLCYMPRSQAKAGQEFDVEIRGKRVPAVVVKTPFYKRPY